MTKACKACGAQHSCAHIDLEYAGIVPPRSSNSRAAKMPPAGGLGRAALNAIPPAPSVRPNHDGEDDVA